MATHNVVTNDILAEQNRFIAEGVKFDRIIADIPSFANRWPGAGGQGKIRDLVSSVIHMSKNCLTDDGTITVSCTGIAQEKWDEWFASEGNTIFELVPDSTWTMFRPYLRQQEHNKHYWGRRDDWTFVRTYRKIGSSYTINRGAWTGEQEERHPNSFKAFPMPQTMNDVDVSAFRAPYHKGLYESKEMQKWLRKYELTYEEGVSSQNGLPIVTVVGSGAHFTDGYVVQFSNNPQDWYHIPKRICQYGSDDKIKFNNDVVNAFFDNKNKGLRALQGGNHKHVMLSAWIIETHTQPGDHVLDPFCGFGGTGAACKVLGRHFTGVEYNNTRANIAGAAGTELNGIVS